MRTRITFLFWLSNIQAKVEESLHNDVIFQKKGNLRPALTSQRKMPHPFESSASWHRNSKIMGQMILPLALFSQLNRISY